MLPTVRSARVEDAAGAAAVYVASAEHHHALDPDLYRVPDVETVTARYRDRIPTGDDEPDLFIAETHGQVIGNCLVRLLPAPSEASMLRPHTAAGWTSPCCPTTAVQVWAGRSWTMPSGGPRLAARDG